MKKKKCWIVKREVMATDIKTALIGKGFVYEVTLAEDRYQPEEKKDLGFKPKKK